MDELSHTSDSINGSLIKDPTSQFYVHHSNNLGIALVTQILIRDNYTLWSTTIIITLSMKNKLGFVDGSISKSKETIMILMHHG